MKKLQTVEILLLLLDDGRIQSQIRTDADADPDPVGPKTYGSCGSGSDTDPQQ